MAMINTREALVAEENHLLGNPGRGRWNHYYLKRAQGELSEPAALIHASRENLHHLEQVARQKARNQARWLDSKGKLALFQSRVAQQSFKNALAVEDQNPRTTNS
jgi:hypothetical protein